MERFVGCGVNNADAGSEISEWKRSSWLILKRIKVGRAITSKNEVLPRKED